MNRRGLEEIPTTTVNTTGTGFTYGTLAADICGNVIGDVTGTVSSIANHTTDTLTESHSQFSSVQFFYRRSMVANIQHPPRLHTK